MNNKVYSYLGIAKKASKLKSGTFQVEEAVKGGKAFLVIIAKDASENTREKFENMCRNNRVKCVVFGDSENLGHSIGNEFRMCLAITDSGLANAVLKALPDDMEVTEDNH
ncbi:MAG: ribosomal L7Ae/L30e/S12e/Gadd45 family protein [Lachnospiraceae bacterium]|nr:ribosomal L7Ae/L30e/S12e/Gadd45 family protein [Lachnospiraceae bacterium]